MQQAMFDAKSILDALMRGGIQPPAQQGALGGLGDLVASVRSRFSNKQCAWSGPRTSGSWAAWLEPS